MKGGTTMNDSNDLLFPLVRERLSRWERSGLSPAQERWFDRISIALVLLFLWGWGYSIASGGTLPVRGVGIFGALSATAGDPNTPPSIGERITQNPLSPGADPLAPTLNRTMLVRTSREYAAALPAEVRGISGQVYVQILDPGEQLRLPTAEGAQVLTRPGDEVTDAVGGAGIFDVVLRAGNLASRVPDLSVIRTVPMSVKQNGRIGNYRIGQWPCERGNCPANPIYATPEGMIEVTPQNKEMYLSEHIQLKDFITKLQDDVWPKYVVVDPQVLDKIELVVQELEAMGHPVENLFAISGFRSPWYNASGGSTAGRGQLSRHMYGDAMDIAVDNDRDGLMDDLNGDGRVNLADARVIGTAVDRVEAKHPELVGGMHYYPPTGGHRGMVHIDTRGNRARW